MSVAGFNGESWVYGVLRCIERSDGPDVANLAYSWFCNLERLPNNAREFRYRFYREYYSGIDCEDTALSVYCS